MRHHILIHEIGDYMAKISFAYCSMHKILVSQVTQKGPFYSYYGIFFISCLYNYLHNLLRIMCLPKVITSNHLIAYFNHIAPWLKTVDVYILRLTRL